MGSVSIQPSELALLFLGDKQFGQGISASFRENTYLYRFNLSGGLCAFATMMVQVAATLSPAVMSAMRLSAVMARMPGQTRRKRDGGLAG